MNSERDLVDFTNIGPIMPISSEFGKDLSTAMTDFGKGYDPYNHVGSFVVAECIGLPI